MRIAMIGQKGIPAHSGGVEQVVDMLARHLTARGHEVIAYCRGPFCVMANQAVRQLRDAGRSARRLDEGWPEWRLASEPAEPTPV